jgi:D-alanine-D-alanine ligase-like ATP-grasp enzyme
VAKVQATRRCRTRWTRRALDADVLCEQFVSGDEVTCPILGTGDAPARCR